jgi:chromate reductase
MAQLRILGISGSLRKGSYNTAALRAARELAPAELEVEILVTPALPIYDADLQAQGLPADVQAVGEKIRAADGLLFATPEYNYSVPGGLKNLIDWVSRLQNQPFAGKPAAVMGASPGATGTARAQYHLRQSGVFLDLRFLNKPEVMIANAAERFDAQGRLTHDKTREMLGKLMLALRDWVLFHRR